MPSRMAGSLSISNNKGVAGFAPGSWRWGRRRAGRQTTAAGRPEYQWQSTSPGRGWSAHTAVLQCARQLVDDGQAQAHALVYMLLLSRTAHELAKDGGQFFWLDARA